MTILVYNLLELTYNHSLIPVLTLKGMSFRLCLNSVCHNYFHTLFAEQMLSTTDTYACVTPLSKSQIQHDVKIAL